MRLLAITRMTLGELRHGKLVVLPLTVAVAILLVAANIENPQAWGDQLLTGMWTGLGVVGALVAILAASGAISAEVERGTMLLLASRPVSRATIVLGKGLGVALYLAGCVALWAVAMALSVGSQLEAGAWTTLWGTSLVILPVLLAAAIALAASTVFPTRGAIGGTLALWFAASLVASIPLAAVRPENVERVDLTQRITGWVVPMRRLEAFPDAVLGGGVPTSAWLAVGVVCAWTALAVVLFRLRRSLAR